MDTTTVAQPAPVVPDETYNRVFRGLALYRERGDEIVPLGRGRYRVPGCRGGSYTVDLAILGGEETCTCPDFDRHHAPCNHIFCATLYRARIQRRRWEEAVAGAKARAEGRSASGLFSPTVGEKSPSIAERVSGAGDAGASL